MTRHQRISSILAFAALIAVAVPGTAAAGSLLSGYGGPGEGNQAILGSALLNTPKGGGGGAGGSGSAGSLGQGSGVRSGEASTAQGTNGTGAPGQGSAGHLGKGTRATKTAPRGSTSQPSQGGSVIYPAASREEAAGGSRALGLSGADFVYIILALGVLAVTGFLTVRLTRTAAARGPGGRP